ncbi:MAG: hypothetical protein L6Q98_20600 [Anaerolineae bacterium]|nr:hypothetical protein [Anaerolineae bacterium]NUQ03965.1 hypothetical protein [Anaerolineae bacterium]
MNAIAWASDPSSGLIPIQPAVSLNWTDENAILRITLRGDLSIEDVTRLDSHVYEALAAEPRCKAVIFDVQNAGRVSPHLMQLRMKRGYPRNHRLEYICIAGEHRLLRLILILTYTSAAASIQFFRDADAAVSFVNKPL